MGNVQYVRTKTQSDGLSDSVICKLISVIIIRGERAEISIVYFAEKTFKNHLTKMVRHGILTEQKEEERTPFSPCRKGEHRFDTEMIPEKRGSFVRSIIPHFFIAINFLGVLHYKR